MHSRTKEKFNKILFILLILLVITVIGFNIWDFLYKTRTFNEICN